MNFIVIGRQPQRCLRCVLERRRYQGSRERSFRHAFRRRDLNPDAHMPDDPRAHHAVLVRFGIAQTRR
jgi:hypothetical protein